MRNLARSLLTRLHPNTTQSKDSTEITSVHLLLDGTMINYDFSKTVQMKVIDTVETFTIFSLTAIVFFTINFLCVTFQK